MLVGTAEILGKGGESREVLHFFCCKLKSTSMQVDQLCNVV